MSRAPCVLLLSLLFAAPAARAELLPFAAPATVGSEGGAIDAAVRGDFDADGDLDIAYASRANARVSWSRNDRTGHAPRATLFNRENVHRLVAADFDQDGRVDLVSATTSGTLAWHRGLPPNAQGEAQFDTRTAIANTLTGITRLAAGDISADGRPDLIVGRDEAAPLHAFVFAGDAGDGFGNDVVVAVPTGAGRIAGLAVADVDDNGIGDVIVSANAASDAPSPLAQVFVVPRASATTFGTPVVVESHAGSPFLSFVFGDLVVDDFDGESGPDLAFTEFGSQGLGQVILRRNQGDGPGVPGGPGRSVLLDSTGRIDALGAADVDRDGDIDVTFAQQDRDGGWLENRRDDGFTERRTGGTFSGGRAVASFAHDDDLDGDPDLFAVTGGGSVRRLRNTRIHGRAEVGVATTIDFGGAFVPIDGPFDVVIRRRGRGRATEVVYTEFLGGFVRSIRFEPIPVNSLLIQPDLPPVVETVGAAREIALFDDRFDGDEDFLLATGASAQTAVGNQNRLVASINTGPGTAPTNTVLPCSQGSDLRGLAVGTFGTLGLKAIYAADGNDRVALASCPGETLISTAANGVPNAPGSAKLGDLDQDGDLDLLVTARLPDAPPLLGDLVGWYPNTGNGVFGVLQRIGTVRGAETATLIDYDRDGKLDVASASQGDPALDPLAGRVLLFRNLGGGAFGAPSVAAIGQNAPGRVAGTDVDHDGDIDLLLTFDSEQARASNRTQCGIALLEASGAGNFAAPQCLDISIRRPYTRLASGDLTGDGTDDIAATSFVDDRVGLVTLTPPQEFSDAQILRLSDTVLGDGEEQCPWAFELETHARPGDSDLSFTTYVLEASAPDSAGIVAALILRRDDGDGLPETGDAEVGRATGAVDGRWTVGLSTGGERIAAGTPRLRYWACLRAAVRVPATGVEFLLRRPDTTVVDASTGVPIPGVFEDASDPSFERTRVRSARIFRDGVEGP